MRSPVPAGRLSSRSKLRRVLGGGVTAVLVSGVVSALVWAAPPVSGAPDDPAGQPGTVSQTVDDVAGLLSGDPGGAAPNVLAPTKDELAGRPVTLQVATETPESKAKAEAKATGLPVVVDSATTESMLTIAQPDGTFKASLSADPVRVRKSGKWVDVDTSLVRRADGSLAPAATKADVVLSGGGGTELVRSTVNGVTVSYGWESKLPAPEIDGSTARYADVRDGADLTVTATATGFETSVVLTRRPAGELAPILFPVSSPGLRVVAAKAGGGFDLVDAKGAVVVHTPAPVAYDASRAERTDLPVMVPLTATIMTGREAQGIQVVPDAKALGDPGLSYPVTIDPSYSSYDWAHTYIDSAYPSTGYYGNDWDSLGLHVGTYNGGGSVNRAMWRFDGASLLNRTIQAAEFDTALNYSWSCSARDVGLYNTDAWDGYVAWNTQPNAGGPWDVQGAAAGYNGSCPAAALQFNATSLIQAFIGGGDGDFKLQLRAQDEGDSAGWKKFAHNAILGVTYTDDNPFGHFDTIDRAAGAVHVRGWAIDPNTTGPLQVHVYAGATYIGVITASTYRPDVGAAYPGFGDYHGFDAVLAFNTPGVTTFTAYAINAGAGTVNSSLGSLAYDLPVDPYGSLDVVRRGNGTGVRVSGWAIDPDTAAPINVHVWLDPFTGSGYDVGATNVARSDVAAAYPTYGTGHGFDVIVPDDGRAHTVCAYGINVINGSANVQLGCQPISASGSVDTGNRAAGTAIPLPVTDRTTAKVSAGTGDLLISTALIPLPGIGQSTTLTATYNSATNTVSPTVAGALGRNWTLSGSQDSRLTRNSDGSVNIIGPDGAVDHWNPDGSGGFTTLDMANADLTKTTAGGTDTYVQAFRTGNASNTYTAPAGAPTAYLTRTETPSVTGTQTTRTYSYGQITSLTDSQGRGLSFTYTSKRLTKITETNSPTSPARTVQFAYDPTNQYLTGITDLNGNTTGFTYTANLITQIQSPNVKKTTIAYDVAPLGRVTSVTSGTGAAEAGATAFGYDIVHSQVTVTDPLSRVTVYDLELATPGNWTTSHSLRVAKTTDPLGHAQAATWTPNGDPATRTNALSQVSTADYSTGDNRLNSTTVPNGGSGAPSARTTQYGYTGAPTTGYGHYQPRSSTNSEQGTTTYGYNASSFNLQTATLGGVGGGTVTYNYQGDAGVTCSAYTGQLCKVTDARSKVTSYNYTPTTGSTGHKGELLSVTPPTGSGVSPTGYTYDIAGRVLTVTTGASPTQVVRTITYDKDDRVTQARTGSTCTATDITNGTCVTYAYDIDGNLTARADRTGTTAYTYNARQWPITKALPGSVTTTAGYDKAGNLTSYAETVSGTTTTLGYVYDQANRLDRMWLPGGSCPALGAAISFPNSTQCIGYTSDDAGRRTDVRYPNAQTTHIGYDPATGQATSIEARNGAGTSLAYRGYAYINTSGGTGPGAGSNLVQSMTTAATTYYCYDAAQRVTIDQAGGTPPICGTTAANYTYDPAGNRLTKVQGGATTYYGYSDYNQLCWHGPANSAGGAQPTACTGATIPAGDTAVSYDNRGNQLTNGATQAFGYSPWDQMTSTTVSSTSTSYTYADTSGDERTAAGTDSFRNGILGMTARTTSGATARFYRDPSGNLVAMASGTSTYYYTADKLGSTLLLTDQTGATAATYAYDTWGNLTSATPNSGVATTPSGVAATNPYRYAAGYTEAATTKTDLIKFGTRYYNPTTGRWTQQDPSHQGSNYYLYAGDNPITNTDPTGRWFGEDWVEDTWDEVSDNWREYADLSAIGTGAILFAYGVATVATGGSALAIGALLVSGVTLGYSAYSYGETYN